MRLVHFCFPVLALCFNFFAVAQSVETLDGKAKIPLDIYKSREANSPTIVYGHGCSGYDNYDIQKARLLRSWGYNVVVAELTRGRGLADKTDAKGRNITCVQGYSAYPVMQRADDFIAIGRWVLKQEWHKGKIGAIGFSLGGGAVEFLINRDDDNPYSAGVSFYPFCRFQQIKEQRTLPNQFHIGTLDEGYERCIGLNKEQGRHNMFIYENATHAFDNDWVGVNRNGFLYDKAATKAAFERVKVFFEAELK